MNDTTATFHGGAPNSVLANKNAEKIKLSMKAKILAFLEKHGPSDTYDICRYFGKTANQLSGRFTDLRAEGKVVHYGDRVRTIDSVKRQFMMLHLPNPGETVENKKASRRKDIEAENTLLLMQIDVMREEIEDLKNRLRRREARKGRRENA